MSMRLVLLPLLCLTIIAAPAGQAPGALQPSDVVYEGFRNVLTNGNASTYGKALTHRYVDGELRFLTVAHLGQLHEFRIADTPLGGTVAQPTATWTLPAGMYDDFTGIWWDAAKSRLWVTRTLDYGDANTFYPTRISVLTLGAGSISNVKTFSLAGVPSKQVFGGAQALPAWAQTALGCEGRPYIVGWGGYTSLVDQTSKASVGPAMFCIPDPDSIGNGATVPASQFKTLLNAVGNRGYRATPYTNLVDDAQWTGTNPAGSYWMTWNDSYYNTGMWIEGTTKRGYVAIATVGTGRVRYADGGVQVDGQGFEMHLWNPARLGDGLLTRPDSMTVLNLPRGNTRTWEDYGVGKITGATYDATSGRMYLIGFPFGTDDHIGRLYSFTVNAGGSSVPPPATGAPVDAVVSEWSAWTGTSDWSACVAGSQARDEERTRTVLTPAANGGATPSLRETRRATRACTSASRLTASLVASGFDRPVGVVPHPSDPTVLVVWQQTGRARLIRNGAIDATDFIDLSGEITAGGEQGLLGLAFAPDFSTSGRVFVNFTDRAGHTVIARFQRVTGNNFRLDPSTRFDLQWPDGRRLIEQPYNNHNGGQIAFGPDGYLYIGMGDGGSANDPQHHAQNPQSLLGKMLRIDVSVATSDSRGYRIPATNPFAATAGVLGEIWAFGLRNPWRWSFDDPTRGGTGALLIGDVGQAAWEEVNYEPRGAGGRNYGWRNREGAHDNVTSPAPYSLPLRDPLLEYDRGTGRTVVGGVVYRGSALGAGYRGRYFLADFITNRVWSVALDVDSTSGEARPDDLREHTADLGGATASPASFGVDGSGEVLIVTYGGSVYRLGASGSGGNGTAPARPYDGPAVGTARPR
jgi:glucose/arabinose dehydrogenase